jgi:hypothetical protein
MGPPHGCEPSAAKGGRIHPKAFQNCSKGNPRLFQNCSETIPKLFRKCSETVPKSVHESRLIKSLRRVGGKNRGKNRCGPSDAVQEAPRTPSRASVPYGATHCIGARDRGGGWGGTGRIGQGGVSVGALNKHRTRSGSLARNCRSASPIFDTPSRQCGGSQ